MREMRKNFKETLEELKKGNLTDKIKENIEKGVKAVIKNYV